MQVSSHTSLKRLDVDTLAKKLKRVQFITKSSADEPFGVLPHGRSVDHIIHTSLTFQRMEELSAWNKGELIYSAAALDFVEIVDKFSLFFIVTFALWSLLDCVMPACQVCVQNLSIWDPNFGYYFWNWTLTKLAT